MLDAADSTGGSTRYCEPCPAGYKCTTTGMIVPEACGAGYYSDVGEKVSCKVC